MSKHIHDLISQGEHKTLDFKFEISNSKKIAKSFSAFSNTDGGKLLIGVKDNGKIAGVRSDEEFYMIEAAAQLYCNPEIEFKFTEWNINGKLVIEVDIPQELNNKPIMARDNDGKWLAYIRVADQNLLANHILLKVWAKEKTEKGVLLEFTDSEKLLLRHLEYNKTITFIQLRKFTGLSYKQAENMLVNFISLKIIDIVFTETQVYYKLSSVKQIRN